MTGLSRKSYFDWTGVFCVFSPESLRCTRCIGSVQCFSTFPFWPRSFFRDCRRDSQTSCLRFEITKKSNSFIKASLKTEQEKKNKYLMPRGSDAWVPPNASTFACPSLHRRLVNRRWSTCWPLQILTLPTKNYLSAFVMISWSCFRFQGCCNHSKSMEHLEE